MVICTVLYNGREETEVKLLGLTPTLYFVFASCTVLYARVRLPPCCRALNSFQSINRPARLFCAVDESVPSVLKPILSRLFVL